MYLLDTDVLIELTRGNAPVQERLALVGLDHCAISEISLAELYVGYYKNHKRLEPLFAFLEASITTLPISSAIKTYAQLRARLESEGKRLDNMDLLIGATALANDCTLVTHNTQHFARIQGLKLEDWMNNESA